MLALGAAGITVILAGWIFDTRGSFDVLFVWFGITAIAATAACLLLPGRRRPALAPAAAD